MQIRIILITLLLIACIGPVAAQSQSEEAVFWQSVQNSNDPAELETYLEAYPDGIYAALARIRIKKLKSKGEDTGQASAVRALGQVQKKKFSVRIGRVEGEDRGWLGVNITEIQHDITKIYGLITAKGVIVTGIVPSGPAAEAGIHPGDLIIEYNRRKISAKRDVVEKVSATPPGQRIDVVVLRLADTVNGFLAKLRGHADKGDTTAMIVLGAFHQASVGTAKDDVKAFNWYRKAAGRGDPVGMRVLGYMLNEGKGTARDEAEAAKWSRRAAEKGDAIAMLNFGFMLESGKGTAKNEAEAVKWFRRAAEKSNVTAMSNLGFMLMFGKGTAKNEAEAVQWFRRAAGRGDPVGMRALGYMLDEGKGTARDEAEAVQWYRKAAEKGDGTAIHNLGKMYDRGEGVARDHRKAARHIFRALRKGNRFTLDQMTTNASAWSKPFRRELQRLMQEAGVYTGKNDGTFGPATKRAIEALAEQKPIDTKQPVSSPAKSAATKTKDELSDLGLEELEQLEQLK